MPDPYPGLTPAQIAVAQALAACPRWTWAPHTAALRPDGALVELMPGHALSRERWLHDGLVPFITDPLVVGHLLAQLEAACGPDVAFTMGRSGGSTSYRCELTAGTYRRTWEGTCLGEAVGLALVARWAALDRCHVPPGKRDPRAGPDDRSGRAHARAAGAGRGRAKDAA